MSTTVEAPPPAINPKLIAPFVNAVRSVFRSMVNVQTTINRPHLKADPCPAHDVSGIIGFSGETSGSVVVSFQMVAAEKLASAFAGIPITSESPDFADAIGELANMIAGSAKKDLGSLANISVPSVIIGRNHQLARLSDVPCIVVPCSTPVGDFCVEVNIKKNSVPKAASEVQK